MDKNIAALLREDCRTVKCKLVKTGEQYTYITNIPVVVGDKVIVEANASGATNYRLIEVTEIDENVSINPGEDIVYKWVVAKIDFTGHEQNMVRNQQIEEAVADAIKANMRRSFAERVLIDLPAEKRASLTQLLK